MYIYYICTYKYKYIIQIHNTSVIYSLFRMAPLLIFTFTLVIVERDTAKVYILQNWTSGDPDHFPEWHDKQQTEGNGRAAL